MRSIENVNPKRERYEGYIPVITRKETARVNIRDVLYIETELRIVNVYTVDRTYRFYGKLDDVQQYLDGNFFRCHKSCIINMEKITRMEDCILYFCGEFTLRIGQNNFRRAKTRYAQYLEQNTRKETQLETRIDL